ncbi:DarT ssDNA thymidine ADP-ribosyltransferase family protein [uncultured Eubacterium sp.]|uniref:DarT ssDNA thymidine ADP-ribosyltransferase family protein n=1 Tax=uncultured Eubacterium sp. TaxID=165185 RepID=UPI0025F10FA8|nr:DarT ssDNA thymidine ADP-ribosyltransferase family protein [uncultured Eubacterium sp.]
MNYCDCVFKIQVGSNSNAKYNVLSCNKTKPTNCNCINIDSVIGKEIIRLIDEGSFKSGAEFYVEKVGVYKVIEVMTVEEYEMMLIQVKKEKDDILLKKVNQVNQAIIPKQTPIEIYEYLLARNVKYLVHFTPIENIDSILKNGICSVFNQIRNGINSLRPDKDRFDGLLDFISCSISFPNYKYKYSKEINENIHFAVILLDIELLKTYNSGEILLSVENAAKNTPFAKSIDELFSEVAYNRITGNKSTRKELKINEYDTTNPQSEILIKGYIDKKYIETICLYSHDYYELIEKGIQSELFDKRATEYLKYRLDYKFWKNDSIREGIEWQDDLPF